MNINVDTGKQNLGGSTKKQRDKVNKPGKPVWEFREPTISGSDKGSLVKNSELCQKLVPKIVNVVGNFQMCVISTRKPAHLDLRSLASVLWRIRYNPRQFSAAIYTIYFHSTCEDKSRIRVTCLIFSSGRITLPGCSNITDSRKAARIITHRIDKAVRAMNGDTTSDPAFAIQDFSIQNLVMSTNIRRRIDMERLAREIRTGWCPEIFPGASVVFDNETLIRLAKRMGIDTVPLCLDITAKVTVVVFASGAINILGARSPDLVLNVIWPYFGPLLMLWSKECE